jgi:hypothetical protein
MVAKCSSETSVKSQHNTKCYIPEDINLLIMNTFIHNYNSRILFCHHDLRLMSQTLVLTSRSPLVQETYSAIDDGYCDVFVRYYT